MGTDKNTLTEVELTKVEATEMIELVQRNKWEFNWSTTNISGLNPSVAIHKLNLNLNARRVV